MADCTCVSCPDCGGTGSIWLDFQGRYLGSHRCDDLDELEPCDSCGGSGVSETCQSCADDCDRDSE